MRMAALRKGGGDGVLLKISGWQKEFSNRNPIMVQKTPVMFTKPLIFSCLIQRVFKNCRMSAFQAVDESPVWWKESEAPPECTKGAPGVEQTNLRNPGRLDGGFTEILFGFFFPQNWGKIFTSPKKSGNCVYFSNGWAKNHQPMEMKPQILIPAMCWSTRSQWW